MNLLIIFVKNAVPGRVKTRLAASIGNKEAASVYRMLLGHTCRVAVRVNADKEVWYSNSVGREDLWEEAGFKKRLQPEGTLGDRMSRAFRTGFDNGYGKIVIIGSDCLQIEPGHIERAFVRLESTDVVTGPSRDGGYYLLGMQRWHPALFEGKPWSQPSLYRETLASLKREGLRWSELEMLNDIDTIEDLIESPIITGL